MPPELTEREQVVAKRIKRDENISDWLATSLSLLCLAGAGVLAFQVYLWLREGVWTSITWADALAWLGMGPPDLPHGRGVEKILRAIGQAPLCVLPIVVAMVAGTLWFNESTDDQETRLVRMKIANVRRGR